MVSAPSRSNRHSHFTRAKRRLYFRLPALMWDAVTFVLPQYVARLHETSPRVKRCWLMTSFVRGSSKKVILLATGVIWLITLGVVGIDRGYYEIAAILLSMKRRFSKYWRGICPLLDPAETMHPAYFRDLRPVSKTIVVASMDSPFMLRHPAEKYES